ncbi:hypothetical protein ACTXT7_002141 [Hymenolepis weldensis]
MLNLVNGVIRFDLGSMLSSSETSFSEKAKTCDNFVMNYPAWMLSPNFRKTPRADSTKNVLNEPGRSVEGR